MRQAAQGLRRRAEKPFLRDGDFLARSDSRNGLRVRLGQRTAWREKRVDLDDDFGESGVGGGAVSLAASRASEVVPCT